MSLYLRGETWWIKYYKNGEMIRRSTGFKNKAKARAVESVITNARSGAIRRNAVETMLADLYEVEPTGTPITELWDIYVRTARSIGRYDSLSASTIRDRRSHVGQFCAWTSAETIEEVDGPLAGLFATYMADQKLKSKTRKNTIGDLSAVWTIISKALPNIDNPWAGLMPHDIDGESGKPFTREQELVIMEAAQKMDGDWYIECLIARHTGLRYGDCARLSWEEIDFNANVIRVTPSKTARHKVALVLPIPAPLLMALKKRARNGHDGLISPMHAAMADGSNGALKRKYKFSDVLAAAGIDGDGYTFHSWRHTVRTRLAEAGVDQGTAKKILGHLTDEMSEHYDHADHIAELRQAMAAASV